MTFEGATGDLPALAGSSPREVFVQGLGKLGTTRQVDIAIGNIRRRSSEHAVMLHLLQLRR
jgi:hypothetical protein